MTVHIVYGGMILGFASAFALTLMMLKKCSRDLADLELQRQELWLLIDTMEPSEQVVVTHNRILMPREIQPSRN